MKLGKMYQKRRHKKHTVINCLKELRYSVMEGFADYGLTILISVVVSAIVNLAIALLYKIQ